MSNIARIFNEFSDADFDNLLINPSFKIEKQPQNQTTKNKQDLWDQLKESPREPDREQMQMQSQDQYREQEPLLPYMSLPCLDIRGEPITNYKKPCYKNTYNNEKYNYSPYANQTTPIQRTPIQCTPIQSTSIQSTSIKNCDDGLLIEDVYKRDVNNLTKEINELFVIAENKATTLEDINKIFKRIDEIKIQLVELTEHIKLQKEYIKKQQERNKQELLLNRYKAYISNKKMYRRHKKRALKCPHAPELQIQELIKMEPLQEALYSIDHEHFKYIISEITQGEFIKIINDIPAPVIQTINQVIIQSLSLSTQTELANIIMSVNQPSFFRRIINTFSRQVTLDEIIQTVQVHSIWNIINTMEKTLFQVILDAIPVQTQKNIFNSLSYESCQIITRVLPEYMLQDLFNNITYDIFKVLCREIPQIPFHTLIKIIPINKFQKITRDLPGGPVNPFDDSYDTLQDFRMHSSFNKTDTEKNNSYEYIINIFDIMDKNKELTYDDIIDIDINEFDINTVDLTEFNEFIKLFNANINKLIDSVNVFKIFIDEQE